MSSLKDAGAALQVDQGSVLELLNQSRMEVQWLKWERDRLSTELEAAKKRARPGEVTPNTGDKPLVDIDSGISWDLPTGDTPRRISLEASQRSGLGSSPELVPRGTGQVGSTPLVRPTPPSPRTNPFLNCEDYCSGQEREMHTKVLSFATRPTAKEPDTAVEKDRKSVV